MTSGHPRSRCADRHRRRVRRARLALLLCTALAGVPARAGQVTLEPAKDNTIYEGSDVSNGKGSGLFTGVNSMGNPRRALLAFDVSGALPAGSTITSVTLRVVVTMGNGGTVPATLHRLQADWGEGDSIAAGTGGQGAPAAHGDATWNYRFFDTVAWSSPGGDFPSTASAQGQLSNGGAAVFDSTPGMVADVRAWLDDPAMNFGWILHGSEGNQVTAKRLASREESSAADRPGLTIVFDPPGGATATSAPTAAPSAPPTATATPSPPPPTHAATTTGSATATSVAPTATATDTPPAHACVGDCDGGGAVSINELVTGVNIALGSLPLDRCPAFDSPGNGAVEINELVAAVNNAINGCPLSVVAALRGCRRVKRAVRGS